jgi:hypothetical protein
MSDVMRIAEERREKLANAIANHETMIARLREDLEALDKFVRFAEDLIDRAAPKTREAQSSDVRGDGDRTAAKNPDVPRIQPAQQAQSA